MPKNKFSISRLSHFIKLLKDGKYPNHPMLLHQMRLADIAGAYSINQKTLQRDVAFLRETYGAPIEYDYRHRGYYLTDPSWTWQSAPFDTAELDIAILSSRLAESIMPSPLGEKASETVAKLLDRPCISEKYSQLLIALIVNGSGIAIRPEIFIEIFNGWLERRLLRIQYTRVMDGASAELVIEPHALAFHEGCWYLRVKVRSTNNMLFRGKDILTLAIHRISCVLQLPEHFATDSTLLNGIANGHIFDFPLIKGIRLKVRDRGYRFATERLHPTILKEYTDGFVEIAIPPIEEYKITNFVFCWPGEVQVLSPASLRKRIRQKALDVQNAHKTGKRTSI